MVILLRSAIKQAIKNKQLFITPLRDDQIGPGSVDLTLDDQFRVFLPARSPIEITEGADYRKITKAKNCKVLMLRPGSMVLGITREKISLGPGLCGWLQGRSRFARLGLMVHVSASFMQPGINNQQVLEICNLGPRALQLHAGMRICQFIVQETRGKGSYQGQFKNQHAP